ncbi:MAG: FAD-dependent oxidoreductase [Symploca sp. SIO2E6]|nr:FAD-dependent oxidoreductase [Symploca sp. SIO2E6]
MNHNFKLLTCGIAIIMALSFGSTFDYLKKTFPSIAKLTNQITNNNSNPPQPAELPIAEYFDVLVYGDELPGICAAIWAKKALGDSGRVALVRSNAATEQLGGLLTRGGLAYLDFDKTYWYEQPAAQCFRNFLAKANIVEACVEPNNADQALKEMLAEAGVTIISDSPLTPYVANQEIQYVDVTESKIRFKARSYIDATQDAQLAREAGLAYYQGYESQSPQLQNATLSVSIIPLITGLSISELRSIEQQIIDDAELMANIETSIREQQTPGLANFWLQDFYSPIYKAYLDGYFNRSIALGAAYHLNYNHPFNLDGFFFDKSNICVLPEDSLSLNGLLFKYPVTQQRQIEANGLKPTQEMMTEMVNFEAWLQDISGKDNVQVIIPPEVYIRHTLSIKDVINPLTGQEIIQGGTKPEDSIGSFSYEFDLRGGVKGLSGRIPSLPIFNFGIEHTLASKVNNLAIVSRSSGYVGMAVSVGRIQTVNVYQGQGVGVAAAIATQSDTPLNTITSVEVRETLEILTGLTTQFYGRDITRGLDYSNIR